MKKLFLVGMVFLVLIFSVHGVRAETLNLVDGGGDLLQEVNILEQGGRWLVDLYDFFASLGYNTRWRPGIGRLEVTREGQQYNFLSGSSRVLVQGREFYNLEAPQKVNGRVYLPVEAAVDFLGSRTGNEVIWNPSRRQLQLARSGSGTEALSGARGSDPVAEMLAEQTGDTSEKSDGSGRLVVIDPGHGGRDPGAIGPNGLQEKDVVLKIARRLKNRIESNYEQLNPRLTRTSDKFVSLENRTRTANKLDADVFVSIHANGSRSSYASGFEVFTLGSKPSDPSAEQLAEIENSALRYEGYNEDELDDVAWILHQLRAVVHTRESQALARKILQGMESELPIPNRGVKQAPLWVLKDAMMPSVLVETGFLSNPDEEQRLRESEYQKLVARSIARQLHKFVREHF